MTENIEAFGARNEQNKGNSILHNSKRINIPMNEVVYRYYGDVC